MPLIWLPRCFIIIALISSCISEWMISPSTLFV